DEDLDEVPIANPVADTNGKPQERVSREPEQQSAQSDTDGRSNQANVSAPAKKESSAARDDRDRGGWRGRRRRGRRDQFPRPAQTETPTENKQYGPPAGHQPNLVPRQTIPKYPKRRSANNCEPRNQRRRGPVEKNHQSSTPK